MNEIDIVCLINKMIEIDIVCNDFWLNKDYIIVFILRDLYIYIL